MNAPEPAQRSTPLPSGDSVASHPATDTQPPLVPDYELLRRIGGGAYGEVWLARSKATGKLRAAKIVWRRTFEDDRPFQREFEGIQRFEQISREHPSQLALFHIGRNESEGYFYYVMELADDNVGQASSLPVQQAPALADQHGKLEASPPAGKMPALHYTPHTLRAELELGRLPAARVLEIGLALTEALTHLHSHDLVHRDVKPSNVIFVNGRPKLADIGLVTDASDQCSIVGTEGYLPPEGPGAPQADIFALGKVLYEAATGMDRREFPKLPDDLRSWADTKLVFELNEIVLKACAGNPRDRYGSAQQIQTDLALIQEGKSVRRQFQRRKFLATARRAGLAALTLGAAAVAFFALWSELDRPYDVSTSPEVNALVEQGFACANGETTERLQRAESYFQEAIKLDPSFVPAHWGLFQVAVNKGEWQWNALPEAHQDLRALADKLKRIAPQRAESHVAAAFIKWLDWEFAEALAEDLTATRERAASKQGRAISHNVYGWHLLQTGHPEEAQVEYLKAKPFEPTSPVVLHHLGHPYFVRRQFPEALKYYQESVRLQPGHSLGYGWVGRVYEETGNFLGAIQQFEEVSRLRGNEPGTNALFQALREAVRQDQDPVHGYWTTRLEFALKPSPQGQDSYLIATLYARLGNTTNAYSYLKEACQKHAFSQGPLFDLCWNHSDTNFQAIVRGIGLLQ